MSEYRFSGGPEMQDWLEQLEGIATRLGDGKTHDYDSAELARMDEVEAHLKVIPLSAVWKAVFRFSAPALIFLALLWGAVLLLRALK